MEAKLQSRLELEGMTALREAITQPSSISDKWPINLELLQPILERYRFRIPNYYFNLIEQPKDPIGLQGLPSLQEAWTENGQLSSLTPVAPYFDQTVSGSYSLFLTDLCPVYCRFCPYKQKPQTEKSISQQDIEKNLDTIQNTPDIHEVILTGGDPLMLSNKRLENILRHLSNISHVHVISIHTRMPSAQPQRINSAFVQMLVKFLPLYFVVHFNHPKELTPAAQKSLKLLADAGIPLVNQSILLKGVNDDVDTLKTLYLQLLNARVRPHTLHQMEIVPGTDHFQIDGETARQLMRSLQQQMSEFSIPQLVLNKASSHQDPTQWPKPQQNEQVEVLEKDAFPKPSKSKTDTNRGQKQNRFHPGSHDFQKGMEYKNLKKIDKAISFFKKAASYQHIQAQLQLAILYYTEKKEFSLAKQILEELLPIYPKVAYNLAIVHDILEESQEAIRWYQQAIRQGVDIAHLNLANLYDNKGDYPNAIFQLQMAIYKELFQANFMLASLYERLGQHDEALSYFLAASHPPSQVPLDDYTSDAPFEDYALSELIGSHPHQVKPSEASNHNSEIISELEASPFSAAPQADASSEKSYFSPEPKLPLVSEEKPLPSIPINVVEIPESEPPDETPPTTDAQQTEEKDSRATEPASDGMEYEDAKESLSMKTNDPEPLKTTEKEPLQIEESPSLKERTLESLETTDKELPQIEENPSKTEIEAEPFTQTEAKPSTQSKTEQSTTSSPSHADPFEAGLQMEHNKQPLEAIIFYNKALEQGDDNGLTAMEQIFSLPFPADVKLKLIKDTIRNEVSEGYFQLAQHYVNNQDLPNAIMAIRRYNRLTKKKYKKGPELLKTIFSQM